MTLRLNQVIPIVRDFKGSAEKEATVALRAFGQAGLFEGHIHTYQPADVEGEVLPQEKLIPQLDWESVLASAFKVMGKHGDNVATMDTGNQSAVATVIVNEHPLLEEVPATHLIWLEKSLVDVRTLINNIPILDPSVDWFFDEEQGRFKSEPITTVRTVKVKKPIVLSEATPEHAANVQLVDTTETVGTWSKVRHSQAIPHPVQQRMLDRVEDILVAIKKARARANSQEVVQIHCFSRILDSIMIAAKTGEAAQ